MTDSVDKKSKSRSHDLLLLWWGWKESNLLPSGYEPPALTDELQPRPEMIL